jgi:hypothetical protein
MPAAQQRLTLRSLPIEHERAIDEKPSFDVVRPTSNASIDGVLRQITAATKTSPLKIMRDYASLAFGPGKVSFKDYVQLRLFDENYYAGCDRRTVVGQRRNYDLAARINFRHDWMGLFANKVASARYLAAYGFPTLPIAAIFEATRSVPSQAIYDAAHLAEFLSDRANYPLFGKPTESQQSLGSIALKEYLADARSVKTFDEKIIPVEQFIQNIATHYKEGYLFQRFTPSHRAIREICGDRLATVRVLTIRAGENPRVLRACWKIPVGSNIADNFWRPGNILAELDLATGCVRRAITGTGPELAEQSRHPDTGATLVGFALPFWEQLMETAVEAARLMRHMPLIGWDMAVLDSGPVIVETNQMPDFFLNQLADRRGILDAEFSDFLRQQERKADEHAKIMKKGVLQL